MILAEINVDEVIVLVYCRGVQIISEGRSQHFCNPLEIPAKDAVPLEVMKECHF